MSAIASILSEKGFKVSGSDLSENYIIKKLRKKNKSFFRSLKNNIKNIDLIVHSSAVKKTNVELKYAKKNTYLF